MMWMMFMNYMTQHGQSQNYLPGNTAYTDPEDRTEF
jgi:hypothetical protein